MPATVTKLADEPIIIVSFVGAGRSVMVRGVYAECATIAQAHPLYEEFYRIWDVRHATASFADVVEIILVARLQLPGGGLDPRFTPVFVGSQELLFFMRDAFKKMLFGGVASPIFRELDEALEYVRFELQQKKG